MPEEISAWAKALPLGEGVRVLCTAEPGIMALEKPAEIMTHPNRPGISHRALLRAEYETEQERYVWSSGERKSEALYLLNRLDSPTSGIVMAALEPGLAKEVRRQFADQKVTKLYYAVVAGFPNPKAGTWIDRLSRQRRGDGGVRVQGGGGLRAETRYEVLQQDVNRLGLVLLKLWPKTGRTHQIRVQAARHGHPILGDRSYGNFKLNRTLQKRIGSKRLFLHAGEVELRFQHRGRSYKFKARSPLPEYFQQILGKRRSK